MMIQKHHEKRNLTRSNTWQVVFLEDFSDNFGGGYRNERGGGCSLPNHGVSGDHSQRVVPAKDGDREVESCDDGHHSEWVPAFQQRVSRPFTWDHLSVQHSK